MASEKPLDREVAVFVKFHLYDKHAFAPFTGQDFSAWKAFLYALQLYGRSDRRGQEMAISIMCSCLLAAQRKRDVWAVFKKSIPAVLDWGYENPLWLQALPIDARSYEDFTFPCVDGARICGHIHSKPSKKHEGYFKCRDCDSEWRPADLDEVRP